MKRRDLDEVFGARGPACRTAATACSSAGLRRGKPVGNFRYYGTRPDDPNDIVPHEHRRELRGARVFGAWLNHDDSRGINSLDMLETTDGRAWVKHYMFDFGSILGSGTVFAQRHRAGNEYIFEQRPGWLTLGDARRYIRPWMPIDYPDVPRSVGRFEADGVRSAEVETRVSQPGLRQHAAGRRVLGRADRRAVHRRDDRRGGARRRGTAIRARPST